MMARIRPCPSCNRNNASHRTACMYCGAALPNPSTPPPQARDDIPAGLDDLIRAAMSGQTSPEEVRAALSASARPPAPAQVLSLPPSRSGPLSGVDDPLPPLLDGSAIEPLTDEEPLYEDEEAWDALDAPTPPMLIPIHALTPLEGRANIDAGLRELEERLQQARAAWQVRDIGATDAILEQLQRQAEALRMDLPPQTRSLHDLEDGTQTPKVSVTMPVTRASVSHTYSLFADCPAQAELAPRIARALNIDGVAAHAVAVCRHPQVVRRSEDRAELEQCAQLYHEVTRLPAAVIPREALLDIDLPRVVVGPSGRRGFQLSSAPLWLGASHDPIRHGSAVREPDIRLAVPGAVVVARYRAADPEQDGPDLQDAWLLTRETRVGVLDLHGPGLFLRIIEDITDFTGLPGHDVRSPRRSFRGFIERLALWFPQARLLGPRICRPTDPPLSPEDTELLPELDIDAWPTWEEHTRLCRLLMKIP